MQLSSKEYFQLIAFQKLWHWRLEKSCLRNHTCLVNHHQRSHWDTIMIGLEGMMNWFLQLNNCQPNQPNPICDRSGKLEDTEHIFVNEGKMSRSHEFDEKRLHKELGSSDWSGKPEKLSQDIPVHHAHDRTGQPVEPSSSSAHTVKEQIVPEENRDIASFNTDNECNRAIEGENIDLKHSRSSKFNSETITWRQRSKTWFSRSRTTLSEKHFKVIFNNIDNSILSVNNHKTWSKQLETLNFVKYSMLNPEHSAKHVCRIGTSASSSARSVTSCEMIRLRDDTTENNNYIKSVLDFFSSPNFYIRKGRPHRHRYGKKEGNQ